MEISISATSLFFRDPDADVSNGECPSCGRQSLRMKVQDHQGDWYVCSNEGCPLSAVGAYIGDSGIVEINNKNFQYPENIAQLRRWATRYRMPNNTKIPKPGDKGKFRSRTKGILNVVVDSIDDDGLHVYEDVKSAPKKVERWFSVKNFSPVPLKPKKGDKVTFKRGVTVPNLNFLDVGGKTVKIEEVSYEPSPISRPTKAKFEEYRKFPRVLVSFRAVEPPRRFLIGIRQFIKK